MGHKCHRKCLTKWGMGRLDGDRRQDNVSAEADWSGVMWPPANECQHLPEARQSQEQSLLWTSARRLAHWTPWFWPRDTDLRLPAFRPVRDYISVISGHEACSTRSLSQQPQETNTLLTCRIWGESHARRPWMERTSDMLQQYVPQGLSSPTPCLCFSLLPWVSLVREMKTWGHVYRTAWWWWRWGWGGDISRFISVLQPHDRVLFFSPYPHKGHWEKYSDWFSWVRGPTCGQSWWLWVELPTVIGSPTRIPRNVRRVVHQRKDRKVGAGCYPQKDDERILGKATEIQINMHAL